MSSVNKKSIFFVLGALVVVVLTVLYFQPVAPPPPPKTTTPIARVQDASADRHPNHLILVADAWPPYNNEADDAREGFMVDIAREILEPAGYRVEYRIVPWKRALDGGADGTYDGVVAPSPNEGPTLVFPKYHLGVSRTCYFVKKGNPWRYTGADSLAAVTVGAIRGYDYADWFNKYLAKHESDPDRVQLVSGKYPLVQNLRKLDAGHIDVVAGNEYTVLYAAHKIHMTDHIAVAGRDRDGSSCYLAFSPKRKDARHLAALVTKGIEEMRANGRLKAILETYGLNEEAIGTSDAGLLPEKHGF